MSPDDPDDKFYTEIPPEGSMRARWNEPLPTMTVPQCHGCKHYFYGTSSCSAFFPVNIPMEILVNEFIHNTEFIGDEGIRFEAGKPIGASD